MFVVDADSGALTRDGEPVDRQLQELFDLLGYDAEEFEQVLDREWWDHDVPRSDETLWLPRDRGEIWDRWVDEFAVAYRSGDSFGPMTIDGWQRICHLDDIYFIVDGGDGLGVTACLVRRRPLRHGPARCARRARGGAPGRIDPP